MVSLRAFRSCRSWITARRWTGGLWGCWCTRWWRDSLRSKPITKTTCSSPSSTMMSCILCGSARRPCPSWGRWVTLAGPVWFRASALLSSPSDSLSRFQTILAALKPTVDSDQNYWLVAVYVTLNRHRRSIIISWASTWRPREPQNLDILNWRSFMQLVF